MRFADSIFQDEPVSSLVTIHVFQMPVSMFDQRFCGSIERIIIVFDPEALRDHNGDVQVQIERRFISLVTIVYSVLKAIKAEVVVVDWAAADDWDVWL
jgi:hypothetical protein